MWIINFRGVARRWARALPIPWLCGSILLSACQPALVPAPRPTPLVLTVAATPALQALEQPLNQCTQEQDNLGLVLLYRPAQALDLSQAALALRWGPARPGDGAGPAYAAVIGQEELVVVVHPQNGLQQISAQEIQAIYTGQTRHWPASPAGDEIQPLGYPQGDETQQIFEDTLLGGSPARANITALVPDAAAMRETVAHTPGAIGFLPRRWVDASLKTLPVADRTPQQLRQPILALSPGEPSGAPKAWLLCLQARLNE